jgi:hypothetical protein
VKEAEMVFTSGGQPLNQPDPGLFSDEYAEAAVNERRAHVGRSHGLELWIATGVAVVFLAWAAWVFVF